MKIKEILFLLLSIIATNHIFAVDDHNYYVRELQDSSGKKVFYIDALHVAPKDYYEDVWKNLENIFYSNKNPIMLMECVHECVAEDFRYDINTYSSYKPIIPLDYELEYYKDNNLPFVQDMIENGFLVKDRCPKKQNSSEEVKEIKKGSRLEYMSYVNDEIIYQEDDLNEKTLKKIKENDIAKFSVLNNVFSDFSDATINADIVLSYLPIFYIFLANFYMYLNTDLQTKFFSDKEIDKLNKLASLVIREYRNDHLLLNIFNTFSTKNTNTIILPWGRNHYPDLARKLEGKEFKEIAKHKLKLFECSSLKREKILNFLLTKMKYPEADIVLQCGSAFDPNGEVLFEKLEDKENSERYALMIYPSFLEYTLEKDDKKVFQMQVYKDGKQKTFRIEEDGKAHIYIRDKDDNLIDESVVDGDMLEML